MTIKDCIDIIDSTKPNQYTITDKVRWLSFIEEIIINDVLKTHEGYDGRYDDFTGYSDNKISVALIVPSPYDRLYTAYLKMKIDEENGETARYNNSAAMFNAYLSEYKKYYNKTHMPLSNDRIRENVKNKANQTKGLTDAEMENLKNELTFILTEYFSNTISNDKVYDVVTKYMQNNVQLLKGKDGNTPIKGQDYFTEADIKAITDKLSSYAKNEIQIMAKDFDDILSEINSKYNNLSSVVENKLPNKVDKEEGKGLSEENYTASDKQLLYSNNRQISELENSMAYKVDAVPGKGLSEMDFTGKDKALLYELNDEMSNKVDKEKGKGLSTEDYTTSEKESVKHLSSYFKQIPDGMTIDELRGNGIYLIDENALLMVSEFPNGWDEVNMQAMTGHEQTKFSSDGAVFYRRKEDTQLDWTDWESKTASIPEYITNYFKILPEDADIDGLDEEGKYIINKRINVADYIETITVRNGKRYVPSSELEYDVVYQVREVFSSSGYKIQQREKDANYGGWINWQDCFGTDGGGETWELLQSREVTEYDGELSELKITFPEGYKEYVVSLERTTPTESTNTIIYPYGKKADGNGELTAFWDYYEGSNASHYEFSFLSMGLNTDNYIKLDGYTYAVNQPVKGKPQTMKTSGWINIGTYGNKVSSWHSVTFKTKLNVGSKYKVWGCK